MPLALTDPFFDPTASFSSQEPVYFPFSAGYGGQCDLLSSIAAGLEQGGWSHVTILDSSATGDIFSWMIPTYDLIHLGPDTSTVDCHQLKILASVMGVGVGIVNPGQSVSGNCPCVQTALAGETIDDTMANLVAVLNDLSPLAFGYIGLFPSGNFFGWMVCRLEWTASSGNTAGPYNDWYQVNIGGPIYMRGGYDVWQSAGTGYEQITLQIGSSDVASAPWSNVTRFYIAYGSVDGAGLFHRGSFYFEYPVGPYNIWAGPNQVVLWSTQVNLAPAVQQLAAQNGTVYSVEPGQSLSSNNWINAGLPSGSIPACGLIASALAPIAPSVIHSTGAILLVGSATGRTQARLHWDGYSMGASFATIDTVATSFGGDASATYYRSNGPNPSGVWRTPSLMFRGLRGAGVTDLLGNSMGSAAYVLTSANCNTDTAGDLIAGTLWDALVITGGESILPYVYENAPTFNSGNKLWRTIATDNVYQNPDPGALTGSLIGVYVLGSAAATAGIGECYRDNVLDVYAD